MSRLAEALVQVTQHFRVDDLAQVLQLPRSTAARWLRSLREGELSLWSAEAVETLARYESDHMTTSWIADALRPPSETGADPSIREVRRQIDITERKNSSLKLRLDDIESHGVFDPGQARVVLDKTEAVLRETTGQQRLLGRLRQSLIRRLRR